MSDQVISKILKQLMFERQIRSAELARQIGLKQPTVHRIVEGTIKKPHLSSLQPLAHYFNITLEQLKGEEPLPSQEPSPLLKAPRTHTLVPIIPWDKIKDWLNNPNTLNLKTIYSNCSLSKNSFALTQEDHSMLPLFPPRTTLIFDPDIKSYDQSYILIYKKDQQAYLFRKLSIRNGRATIQAINPTFSKEVFPVNDDDTIIAVISQSQMDY